MSHANPRIGRRSGAQGFTLIEVVAALVVFAAGVLAILNLSNSISRQLELAAVRSEMVREAEQGIDSLSATPYAALALGESGDTLTVRGLVYERRVTVTQYSPLLKQVELRMEPRSEEAPSHTVNAWIASRW